MEPDEAMLIKFLLASGFRDREVRYVVWRDIDFRQGVLRVTAKPLWKFHPKNYEERIVPVPAKLIEQLQRLKTQRDAAPSQLVFPNTKGNPIACTSKSSNASPIAPNAIADNA